MRLFKLQEYPTPTASSKAFAVIERLTKHRSNRVTQREFPKPTNSPPVRWISKREAPRTANEPWVFVFDVPVEDRDLQCSECGGDAEVFQNEVRGLHNDFQS